MIEILGYIFAGIITVGLSLVVYIVLVEMLAYAVLTSANFYKYKTKIDELETRLENLEPKDKSNEC